jgi:hypothetical protein
MLSRIAMARLRAQLEDEMGTLALVFVSVDATFASGFSAAGSARVYLIGGRFLVAGLWLEQQRLRNEHA